MSHELAVGCAAAANHASSRGGGEFSVFLSVKVSAALGSLLRVLVPTWGWGQVSLLQPALTPRERNDGDLEHAVTSAQKCHTED